jgi:hypothetical protein
MSFLRHGQIYQSDEGQNRDRRFAPVPAIVSMSLRPAIPWRVGLHQSPPPLRRLLSMLKEVVVGVNHHLMGGGEFSTGGMGNFQPALTRPAELLTHHTWALSRGSGPVVSQPDRPSATEALPTPPQVGPSPTGDSRLWGARSFGHFQKHLAGLPRGIRAAWAGPSR